MPRPGGGNVIVYGKIEIASDATLADVLQALSTVLEKHGYPEEDRKRQEVKEEDEVAKEAKKLLDDYERQVRVEGRSSWRKE